MARSNGQSKTINHGFTSSALLKGTNEDVDLSELILKDCIKARPKVLILLKQILLTNLEAFSLKVAIRGMIIMPMLRMWKQSSRSD
jgi:hypothetical protein